MSPLEIVAALPVFGAVSVYLSARQRIASWPTAIVNVLLSAVVYYRARLYSTRGCSSSTSRSASTAGTSGSTAAPTAPSCR
jgi:hypothetical protein